MIERDPNIVQSGLSRTVKKDGVTVEVSIIRLEHETQWSLEVVNSAATSIVWDELFASDEDAYAEFERTVADEGMQGVPRQRKRDPFPPVNAPRSGQRFGARAAPSRNVVCENTFLD